MLPLPAVASETSPRVILGRPGGYDPNVYKPEIIMKSFALIGDLLHEEDDQMIIAGQINVIDLKEASMANFAAFSPQLMRKMAALMQDASPFRLKGIYYINAPPFFEKFFSFVRQFLNAKIQSRVRNLKFLEL